MLMPLTLALVLLASTISTFLWVTGCRSCFNIGHRSVAKDQASDHWPYGAFKKVSKQTLQAY